MMRELTVRENILFSARMRLPRQGWSDTEIQRYVDAVIEVLGLSECSDTLIGDVSSRGVSGGQRKRTNIGIELAVAPAAIFLEYGFYCNSLCIHWVCATNTTLQRTNIWLGLLSGFGSV
jgi:ABC-type sulfate/molybdate transport systems ATPase subunit